MLEQQQQQGGQVEQPREWFERLEDQVEQSGSQVEQLHSGYGR